MCTSLLQIITLCFTCGERKTCTTIKKPQKIMSMISENFIENYSSISECPLDLPRVKGSRTSLSSSDEHLRKLYL